MVFGQYNYWIFTVDNRKFIFSLLFLNDPNKTIYLIFKESTRNFNIFNSWGTCWKLEFLQWTNLHTKKNFLCFLNITYSVDSAPLRIPIDFWFFIDLTAHFANECWMMQHTKTRFNSKLISRLHRSIFLT